MKIYECPYVAWNHSLPPVLDLFQTDQHANYVTRAGMTVRFKSIIKAPQRNSRHLESHRLIPNLYSIQLDVCVHIVHLNNLSSHNYTRHFYLVQSL